MKFIFLERAYFKGEFVDFKDANISVSNNAFQFGTAVWGGMRVKVVEEGGKFSAKIFRLDEHVKRLYDGSKMLFLEKEFTKDFLQEKIIQFIKENKNIRTGFYIRPIIYDSANGPMPTFSKEKELVIYGTELGDYLDQKGISVCVSYFRRQDDIMIPTRGKISGAYYISCAAKIEAMNRGYDDCIMLTQTGKVSEGSAMNVFMVRDGCLVTPPGTDSILEGITRKSVIEIAKYLNIEVIERSIDLSELMYKSDEVFFTGTAAKLTPCYKIENSYLRSDFKVFNKIKQEFDKIVNGDNPDFSYWTTTVPLV
jgi:branched-chain amino acid aminotransferase